MTAQTLILNDPRQLSGLGQQLREALRICGRLEVKWKQHKSTRSTEQNSRMWAMLADVARQVDWYGKKLTSEEWKDVFSASLKRQQVVPGIDGGFVVLGQRTSKMSISEMSDLITLMLAFGADPAHIVYWTDPTYQELIGEAA